MVKMIRKDKAVVEVEESYVVEKLQKGYKLLNNKSIIQSKWHAIAVAMIAIGILGIIIGFNEIWAAYYSNIFIGIIDVSIASIIIVIGIILVSKKSSIEESKNLHNSLNDTNFSGKNIILVTGLIFSFFAPSISILFYGLLLGDIWGKRSMKKYQL